MRTLLLDIDDTLLNTKKLISIINKQVLAIIKLSETELQALINQYLKQLDTSFTNPEDYCNYLNKKLNPSAEKKQQLIDVFYKKTQKYHNCLFADTKIIPQLAEKYQLGIFSQGGEKFQTAKYLNSGLAQYFNSDLIFINTNKTAPQFLEKLPEEAIIIDNNLKIIKKLLSHQRKAIWLNRKTKEKLVAKTIFSLTELS